MTLSSYRDELIQKAEDEFSAGNRQQAVQVATVALVLKQMLASDSSATAAEILNAIQTATNINDLETLLQAVRDRLVQGAGVEAQAQRFTLATDGIGATRLTEIKDRLILGGPALNLGAVNAQTQRVVDAASLFGTTSVGNYDGTFTASGTSALAAQNIQQIDLQGVGRSEFSLSVTCTNSVAAVGAGRTMTFYYAFSPDSGITSPTEFARFIVLPEIPLTNALNAVNRLTSDRFFGLARYLYTWHDRTPFNASAVITPRVRLNPL